jgi:hypothetical protein
MSKKLGGIGTVVEPSLHHLNVEDSSLATIVCTGREKMVWSEWRMVKGEGWMVNGGWMVGEWWVNGGWMVGGEWWVVSGEWWMVNGKWWMVNGEWWMVSGEWWMMNGEWWVNGGWWVVNGEWWMVNGKWWVVSGEWWMVNGEFNQWVKQNLRTQQQQQLHSKAVFLVVCDPSMNELWVT